MAGGLVNEGDLLGSIDRLEGRDTVITVVLHAMARYHAMDKTGLLPEQHGEALIKLAHLRDLASLEMAEHTVELDKSRAAVDDWGSTSTVDWLRHNGRVTSTAAGDCLHVGEQLVNLPRTLEAVRDGRIGFAHAAIIARHAQVVTDSESAEPFDERPFLKIAEETSPSKLWYHAMHHWHRMDPDGVANAQREVAVARYLRFTEDGDGAVFVKGMFDSAAGASIRTALEPLAQPHGDEDLRNKERRDADALVELAEHALDTGSLPQHGTVRPHVQVMTTLETLQGLIGSPAGEMALSVPIAAKTVQRLACDSSITRVLLGADSAVIDAGRSKRVVSRAVRRVLEARDKFCRWPGCERPASWTAAHHMIHWAHGGMTDLDNLILLCRHHHWNVHEGGWRLSLAADGRVIAVPPETFYPVSVYAAEFAIASQESQDHGAEYHPADFESGDEPVATPAAMARAPDEFDAA